MDDATIQNLRQAFLATPGNGALLAVLLDSYLARDEAQAGYELLAQYQGQPLQAGQRLACARIALEAGHPDEAVVWADADTPESLIIRASALASLDRYEEGRRAYDQAVAANAALEDQALLLRLIGRIKSFKPRQAGGPKLTVISNDDTREQDVARMVEPAGERVTFEDIGGLDDIKEQVRRKIILPFQKPSLFQRFRKRAGGGILLYGPPGCGKTLIARATAGECGAKFFNVAISDVLDMYIGESERKLQALFDKARQSAPSVLFFDEIEALGGKRQYSREATSAKVVSQFLAEMDGFAQRNEGVLVMGATNVPWAVDSAFRRPGRFDRVQFVPPPDRAARQSILDILLRDRPVATGIDLEFLARNTSGFSGADLRHLVETAVEHAIEASIDQGREIPVTDANLRNALKEVRPTTLEWLTTARNYARYANEAGQYDEVLAFLQKNSSA
jgi:transitional endoplasmic reticulum ATPase